MVPIKSVCAVFVTYHPSPAFLENIRTAREQVSSIIVVDNGSSEDAEAYFRELEAWEHCKVIRNQQNLGIAAALNRGIAYALDASCDWVVTFDQDSMISAGFIAKMLDTYEHDLMPEEIAILAPTYVDRESGVVGRLMRTASGEILTTMTSGSMMPANIIRMVGPFDENLYMDYVDIDFSLRVRRKGLRIVQSTAVLLHSLGRTTYHSIAGLRYGATNHTSARRFYITRNRCKLLMRNATDWAWAWREFRAMLFETVKILLVEDDKVAKIRAMASGISEALRGKVGKQVEL